MKFYFQRTIKKETAVFGNQYARFPKKWIVRYCVEASGKEHAEKELEREILISGYENKYFHSVKCN